MKGITNESRRFLEPLRKEQPLKKYWITLSVLAVVLAACTGPVIDEVRSAQGIEAGAPAGDVVLPVEMLSEDAHEQAGHAGELEVPELVVEDKELDSDGHGPEAVIEDTHQATAAADEVRIVGISLSEFAFSPSAVEVSAGETVKFVVTNDGLVEHELRFSNAHRIEEHLASGHEGHGDQGHHGSGDVFVAVAPGASAELLVHFPEDETVFTEIACLIPGHFEAGMKGTISYAKA